MAASAPSASRGMATAMSQSEHQLVRQRQRQWVYLGPIIAAPIAHVAVSCYRHVKTQNGKRALIAFGVVGATFGSVFMRLYLMKHAGYPCGDDQHNDRIVDVSADQAERMKHPSVFKVLAEAVKGAL